MKVAFEWRGRRSDISNHVHLCGQAEALAAVSRANEQITQGTGRGPYSSSFFFHDRNVLLLSGTNLTFWTWFSRLQKRGLAKAWHPHHYIITTASLWCSRASSPSVWATNNLLYPAQDSLSSKSLLRFPLPLTSALFMKFTPFWVPTILPWICQCYLNNLL